MSSEILREAIEDQVAGRLAEAADKLRGLVARSPDDASAVERLAFVCHAMGDLQAAAKAFKSLCHLLPMSAKARGNLATVLGQLGRYDEAVRHYEQAIALDPTFVEAQFNLAQMYEMRGLTNAAIAGYRRVLDRRPSDKLAWYRLGYVQFASGFRAEAQASYGRAIELDPLFVESRWALAMSALPLAYDVGESPDASYAEFATRLDALDRWFADGRDELGHRAVGNQQPYYLNYHARNNREILSRYGNLCARLMKRWYGEHAIVTSPDHAKRIHVAIVSGNIRDHAVWTAIVRGWCQHIDRKKFRLSILYTDSVADRETETARASVETFVQGKKPLSEWVDTIRNCGPDVLIYPEIGMDAICIKLAALRLAPVQAVSWGNPETSGMPEVDYFLSAEAFEPPDAQKNYRERVVALAGIGAYYGALDPPRVALDIRQLGLDPAVPIVFCPATAYKFLPEHDWTIAAIAKGAPGCRIVFVTDELAPYLSEQLARRFEREFERAGVDYSSVVQFVPHQPRSQYFSLMQQSAIYLDTIVFSGFNTAMQALECGLPVVTVEGRFLRSRFASGLLRVMGIDELVSVDTEAYVKLAVRLLNDAEFMRATRKKIAARFPSLLNQTDSVRSLERFFESVVPREGATRADISTR